jgi:hypothetical protein
MSPELLTAMPTGNWNITSASSAAVRFVFTPGRKDDSHVPANCQFSVGADTQRSIAQRDSVRPHREAEWMGAFGQ